MLSSVFIVTEPQFPDRGVLGVTATLESARQLIMSVSELTAEDEPYWQFSESPKFMLDQGYAELYRDGIFTGFRAEWKEIEG